MRDGEGEETITLFPFMNRRDCLGDRFNVEKKFVPLQRHSYGVLGFELGEIYKIQGHASYAITGFLSLFVLFGAF